MTVVAGVAVAQLTATQPRLVFFTSSVSGHCRRVEGFLAQVLQRRRNHGTFRVLLVEGTIGPTAWSTSTSRPSGCREIERTLAPWLN